MAMRGVLVGAILGLALPGWPLLAAAEPVTTTVAPATLREWKAVYGRIEARDTIAARARIGGSLVSVDVTEGTTVAAGQRIATVIDEKLAFQVTAIDAQIKALQAQLANAVADLKRGQDLVRQGVSTNQRVGQLQTQVDVIAGQADAASAQRQVLLQQGSEGDVVAPADGRVISVPVTRGAVIMPGEPVAVIASGGLYLRLAIPERHAALLAENAPIPVETPKGPVEGRLAKLYPLIENGRVIADVELPGLETSFIDARLLVRVPIGERRAITVPASAVSTRSGIDFVRVVTAGETMVERTVVPGERTVAENGVEMVEILTGLSEGDTLVVSGDDH